MDHHVSLDKAQRTALMNCYLDHYEAAVQQRCHMILLLGDGFSAERVAEVTSSTADEVRECIGRFRTGGVDAMIGNRLHSVTSPNEPG